MLKFPILNPTPYRLKVREQRLRKTFKHLHRESEHRRMLLEETKDPKYAVLQGTMTVFSFLFE